MQLRDGGGMLEYYLYSDVGQDSLGIAAPCIGDVRQRAFHPCLRPRIG